MKLFEITDGTVGFAYVRVYAWNVDKTKALEMAKSKFKEGATLKARLLFNSNEEPFCTETSSEGWEMANAGGIFEKEK